MATLSPEALNEATRRFVDGCAAAGLKIHVTKADMKAAVTATDAWINANSSAYNNALPQPFRGAHDALTKSLLFNAVSTVRYGSGA